MTIAFYKFKCIIDKDGTIYSKYDLKLDGGLHSQILETLEDLSEEFPLNFMFCDITDLPETWIQIFIIRNMQLYEVIRKKNFIILIERAKEIEGYQSEEY